MEKLKYREDKWFAQGDTHSLEVKEERKMGMRIRKYDGAGSMAFLTSIKLSVIAER